MPRKTSVRRKAESTVTTSRSIQRNYVAEVRSDCRKSINSFLSDGVVNSKKSQPTTAVKILIAAGPPGTGKTCTISEILDSYKPKRNVITLMGNQIKNMSDLITALAQPLPRRTTRRNAALQTQNTQEAFSSISTYRKEGRNLIIFIDEFDLIFELNAERIRTSLHQFTKILLNEYLVHAKLIVSLNNYEFIDKWSYQLGTFENYTVVHFNPYTVEDAFEIAFKIWPTMKDQKTYEFAVRKIIKKTNGDLRQLLSQLSRFVVQDDSEEEVEGENRFPDNPSEHSETTPRADSGKRGRSKRKSSEESPPKIVPKTTRSKYDDFCEINSEGPSQDLMVGISADGEEDTETTAAYESNDWLGQQNKATYHSPPKPKNQNRTKGLSKARTCSLEDVQQELGAKYMTASNAIVQKISALPRVQQLICAAICVLIDRDIKTKNLSLNDLYRTYRELTDENHVSDALTRSELESELHILNMQGIISHKNPTGSITPATPQVKVTRNRTPIIKQRLPNMRPAQNNLQFDFPLDLVGTCAAFEKLKSNMIYGFTMTRMTQADDTSD